MVVVADVAVDIVVVVAAAADIVAGVVCFVAGGIVVVVADTVDPVAVHTFRTASSTHIVHGHGTKARLAAAGGVAAVPPWSCFYGKREIFAACRLEMLEGLMVPEKTSFLAFLVDLGSF